MNKNYTDVKSIVENTNFQDIDVEGCKRILKNLVDTNILLLRATNTFYVGINDINTLRNLANKNASSGNANQDYIKILDNIKESLKKYYVTVLPREPYSCDNALTSIDRILNILFKRDFGCEHYYIMLLNENIDIIHLIDCLIAKYKKQDGADTISDTAIEIIMNFIMNSNY